VTTVGAETEARDKLESANILGVPVAIVDMKGALERVEGWIVGRRPGFVIFRDVHGVMRCREDEALRRCHEQAAMVVPDGMPLVWVSRLMGYRETGRVCGPDFLPALCERSLTTGWSHFFYGGAPGVAERLADELSARFSGLRIAGTWSPPFRPLTEEEDSEACSMIKDSGADIVWVGLSTPKQEHWMAAHAGRVGAPMLMGVGAAFDFHAGLVPRAPLWMQRTGLEWLHRLLAEPRRLWRRYLVLAPAFVVLMAGQILGIKR